MQAFEKSVDKMEERTEQMEKAYGGGGEGGA